MIFYSKKTFLTACYRRVCEWLRGQGIEHIGLDSDGNITSLIPLWMDAGIDHLWPFEVQAGMDVVGVRRQYGRRLAIMGGLASACWLRAATSCVARWTA